MGYRRSPGACTRGGNCSGVHELRALCDPACLAAALGGDVKIAVLDLGRAFLAERPAIHGAVAIRMEPFDPYPQPAAREPVPWICTALSKLIFRGAQLPALFDMRPSFNCTLPPCAPRCAAKDVCVRAGEIICTRIFKRPPQ